MNKNTKLMAVGLGVLLLAAWGKTFSTTRQNGVRYASEMETGSDYMTRGLYEKAAQTFLSAAGYRNTAEAHQRALEAYEQAYLEDRHTYRAYKKAAEEAVERHPENKVFLEKLVKLLINEKEYTSAYRYLSKATGEARTDDKMRKLRKEVLYSFQLDWKRYLDYRPLSEGYYAVSEDGSWDYLNADGVSDQSEGLSMAGPVGEKGIRLIVNDSRAMLIGKGGMPEGYVSGTPSDAGVYREGLIPLKIGGTYAFYDLLGDKQFGAYKHASAFTGGKAAVEEGNGWFLIDRTGKRISENSYEDIRLNPDGSCMNRGVMLAKQNGVYYLWNDKEKKISEEGFEDADCVTADHGIAVKKNGKWGFVNGKGRELLPAIYEEAKSFSCGLAGVKEGESWGFLDSDGDVVISPQFTQVDYFNKKGNCLVKPYDGWSFLTRNVKE